MTPDSLTPTPADGQLTGGATASTVDLILQIEQEMTRIQQESQSLKQQAAQKDEQLAGMRVRLATLTGTKSQAVKTTPHIGQTIMENGVCTGILLVGVCELKNRSGKNIGKFRVIAAPEDLTDKSGKRTLLTFKNTGKALTKKKNWHGYDGGSLAVLENDTGLYKGLANGSALNKWVFPTKDLLHGKDIQPDNLYAHKNTGAFKGPDSKSTYVTVDTGHDGNSGYPVWYWSCTEHRDYPSDVYLVRFSDGDDGWHYKDLNRLSCRPVRFEALNI